MPADSSPAGVPSGHGAAPGVRASDADRDRVLDVLRAAAGDGRLTADEFNERMEAALSSRTLGELATLTADLGTGPGGSGRPAVQAENTVRLTQRGGSVGRVGRWVVPRRFKLQLRWCGVTLDFTDAVITHDTLHIDMKMRGGSLTLVTKPGIEVNADSLKARWSHIMVGPSADPGAPAVLHVQLAGRVRYAKIEARQPGQPSRSPKSN